MRISIIGFLLLFSVSLTFSQEYVKYSKANYGVNKWSLLLVSDFDEYKIAEISKGTQFIQTSNGTVYSRQKNGLLCFKQDNIKLLNTSNLLPADDISVIANDSSDNVWMKANKGIIKMKGEDVQFFDKKNGLPTNNIKDVIVDMHDNIWINTNKETYRYNTKGEWESIDVITSMPGKIITDAKGCPYFISEDKKHVGTYENSSFSIKNINEEIIHHIADKNGSIWLLTSTRFIQLQSATITEHTLNSPAPGVLSKINGICSGDNKFWISTYFNGLNYYDENNWKIYNRENGLSGWIVFVARDVNDDIWVGTLTKGLYKISDDMVSNVSGGEDSFRKIGTLRDVFIDSNNNLWFSSSKTLLFYDTKKRELKNFKDEINGMFNTDGSGLAAQYSNVIDFFFTFKQSSDGKIWIALTARKSANTSKVAGSVETAIIVGGIAYYENGSFNTFLEKKDNDAYLSIFEDNDKTIWVDGLYSVIKINQ